MAGQNDLRANHIIGKLMGLRENLNDAVGQMESDIDLTGNENNELRNKLKRAEGQPRTVYTEDSETFRRLEKEIETLRRENKSLKDREYSVRSDYQKVEQENKRIYEQLDRIKANSFKLLGRNKELDKIRRESDMDLIRQEIDEERKRSMGAEEYARKKYNEY